MVTMQNNKTLRAFEDSPIQRHINILPTVIAPMATPSCSWVLHTTSTACYSFVFQEVCEHSPSSIAYLLRPEAVIHHTFDVQLLDGDERISIDNLPAEFMQEITPLVGNLVLQPCYFESCFSPVFRAFDLPAQSSLQKLEPLFGLDEEARILNLLSIGESCEALQSDIDADLFSRRMLDFDIRQLTGEDSKPLPDLILLDGQSLDLSLRDTMQDNRHRTNLAQSEPSVRQQFESALGESDAVHPTLEARKSLFLAGLVLDPAKEVGESLMHSIRDILNNLRMDRILAFDEIIIIKFVEANRAELVGINRQCKKLIVDCLTSLERINDSYLLLSRRINPEFIHQQAHIRGIVC